VLAQSTTNSEGSPLSGFILLGLIVLWVAGAWRVYSKAGEPGWAAIVPIYNAVVEAKIAGKNGWWVFLEWILGVFGWLLIRPIIGIGVAKHFGRSGAFGVGLGLLPFVFYPILAWDGSEYTPDIERAPLRPDLQPSSLSPR
jgi:hypothetical protein